MCYIKGMLLKEEEACALPAHSGLLAQVDINVPHGENKLARKLLHCKN